MYKYLVIKGDKTYFTNEEPHYIKGALIYELIANYK